MNLLIDAVFFQLASSGIARVWKSILTRIANHNDIKLYILDRGRAPEITGATIIPFPTYNLSHNTAADSLLIQEICDLFKIDVFASTYYTSPVRTPSCLIVYDMIPELLGFDLSARDWREKELSILYSQAQISISESTRCDLLQFYPHLDPVKSTFCHLSIDKNVFRPRSNAEIDLFRKKENIRKPYYLFVGSREQHNNYKNAVIFFDCVRKFDNFDFEVVCVGGEIGFGKDATELQKRGLKITRVDLNDDMLAAAYSGAVALIYPSLYEGFGFPVLEAMGSGCPVITTDRGSLKEVAGDGARFISGYSTEEMAQALEDVRNSATRERLVESGLKNVERFDWDVFANHFVNVCRQICEESAEVSYDAFYERWAELRKFQADVDYL